MIMKTKFKNIFTNNKILKKITLFIFLVALILLSVFSTQFFFSEFKKLQKYNVYVDKTRIALKENNLNQASNELENAKNIVVNSKILYKIKKTELWLLSELNSLYKEKEKFIELSKFEDNNKFVESKDEAEVVIPISTSIPSIIPTPSPTTLLIAEPVVSEGYIENDKYPIIRSFSDNLGFIIKRSSYNGYNGVHTSVSSGKVLKVGDEITWNVTASDPSNRELKYNFNSSSQRFNDVYGRGEYKTANNFTYQVTQDDLKSAGETLRIVVQIRSEKDNYRFGSGQYDDSIFLDYTLIQ
jgi:hypothetical protein